MNPELTPEITKAEPVSSATSGPRAVSGPRPMPRGMAARLNDLRRRSMRLDAEAILGRSQWLPPADRALVAAVFDRGQRLRDLSRLTGTPERTLRRRLKALVRRALSVEFAFVASRHAQWSPTLRAVAVAVFLHGRSIRAVASDLGLSTYTVRLKRDTVTSMMLGLGEVETRRIARFGRPGAPERTDHAA